MLDNLKKELQALAQKNRLEELMQQLLQIFDLETSAEREVSTIVISSRWSRLKRKRIENRISDENYNIEENNITNSLLVVINEITEEEAQAYDLKYGIFKKLLIVCPTKERIEKMKQFFSKRYRNNEHTTQLLSKEEVSEYDLVIFDNQVKKSLSNSNKMPDLLKDYINQTDAYILYYGEHLSDLSNYKERVYTANFKFSLHSRLQEMLTFLEHETSSI
jgi:hypothetical protein